MKTNIWVLLSYNLHNGKKTVLNISLESPYVVYPAFKHLKVGWVEVRSLVDDKGMFKTFSDDFTLTIQVYEEVCTTKKHSILY